MISFRWRMLRSFESCHDIGSSKCFRVPGRITTGNAMQVFAVRGACSGVDQSQARLVSARASERVGYTSSLLRISQLGMQVLRVWTITSWRVAHWVRQKEPTISPTLRGTFNPLYAYQSMNQR